MFEFYGWACIRSDTYESDEADNRLLTSLREKVGLLEQHNIVATVSKGFLNTLTVVGHKNHRYEAVIDLFRWLAEDGPGSYGLLYVQDDEDHQRDDDYQEVFRVWRLARGTLQELDDPFLSPRVPTIEDPYDPQNRPG
jgi:hypothetical protein